jgi:hypothetical protein
VVLGKTDLVGFGAFEVDVDRLLSWMLMEDGHGRSERWQGGVTTTTSRLVFDYSGLA